MSKKGVVTLLIDLGGPKKEATIGLNASLGPAKFPRVASVIEKAAMDTGLGPARERAGKTKVWVLHKGRFRSKRRRMDFYKFITKELVAYSVVFRGPDGDGETYKLGFLDNDEYYEAYRELTAEEAELAMKSTELLKKRANLYKDFR